MATALPLPPASRPADIVIIDDSAVVRSALTRIVKQSSDLRVAGAFPGAEAAIAWLGKARAELIMLDLNMPGIDGLSAMPALIAAARGAPILIVSSSAKAGAEATIRALALGAADTLEKPTAGLNKAFEGHLIRRAIALVRGNKARTAVIREPVALRAPPRIRPKLLALGASTGGIQALEAFIAALPRDDDTPILVTQHLPPAFVPFFTQQLGQRTGRTARVAAEGMDILPGTLTVAPGDAHLGLVRRDSGGRVALRQDAMPTRCRPSLDIMLADVADVYAERALAVVLTGMGADGREGARALVAAGGAVVAQDAPSSIVWGMPGAVARAGLVCRLDTPAGLARFVARLPA